MIKNGKLIALVSSSWIISSRCRCLESLSLNLWIENIYVSMVNENKRILLMCWDNGGCVAQYPSVNSVMLTVKSLDDLSYWRHQGFLLDSPFETYVLSAFFTFVHFKFSKVYLIVSVIHRVRNKLIQLACFWLYQTIIFFKCAKWLNLNHSILLLAWQFNSGSSPVQILLAACWRFKMVRDLTMLLALAWRFSPNNHATKIIYIITNLLYCIT